MNDECILHSNLKHDTVTPMNSDTHPTLYVDSDACFLFTASHTPSVSVSGASLQLLDPAGTIFEARVISAEDYDAKVVRHVDGKAFYRKVTTYRTRGDRGRWPVAAGARPPAVLPRCQPPCPPAGAVPHLPVLHRPLHHCGRHGGRVVPLLPHRPAAALHPQVCPIWVPSHC